MFARLCLVLTLLTGCRSAKPAASAPGTSLPLTYPVVLIGQGSISVRDDPGSLTSTTGASGLNFLERKIFDSTGAIFDIKQAEVVGPSTAWWRDAGTSQQAYFLKLEKRPASTLDDIKRLVREQLESPQGVWQERPAVVDTMLGFTSVQELIEGSRTAWEWGL